MPDSLWGRPRLGLSLRTTAGLRGRGCGWFSRARLYKHAAKPPGRSATALVHNFHVIFSWRSLCWVPKKASTVHLPTWSFAAEQTVLTNPLSRGSGRNRSDSAWRFRRRAYRTPPDCAVIRRSSVCCVQWRDLQATSSNRLQYEEALGRSQSEPASRQSTRPPPA
jgi:hypothetical protein